MLFRINILFFYFVIVIYSIQFFNIRNPIPEKTRSHADRCHVNFNSVPFHFFNLPDKNNGYFTFSGKLIIYKDLSYLLYKSSSTGKVVIFDGVKLSPLIDPENNSNSSPGVLGNAIVFNDKVYVEYESNQKAFLAECDPAGLKLNALPENFMYWSIEKCFPVICNGKLYVQGLNKISHQYELISFDGNFFSMIPPPENEIYSGNPSPVAYGNKLYLNSSQHLMAYDGTVFHVINEYRFAQPPLIYLNKLFAEVLYHPNPKNEGVSKFKWVQFDGLQFTSVPLPEENGMVMNFSVTKNDTLFFLYRSPLTGLAFARYDGKKISVVKGDDIDSHGSLSSGVNMNILPVICGNSIFFLYHRPNQIVEYDGTRVKLIPASAINYQRTGDIVAYMKSLFLVIYEGSGHLEEYDGRNSHVIGDIRDYDTKGFLFLYKDKLFLEVNDKLAYYQDQ